MSVYAVTKVLIDRGEDIDPGRNADLALLLAATNYSIIRSHEVTLQKINQRK